jgi:hypothetical protein
MTHFQRTPDQGDMLVSTLALPLLFPGVKMSLGVVPEDWRCQSPTSELVFCSPRPLILIEYTFFGLCGGE